MSYLHLEGSIVGSPGTGVLVGGTDVLVAVGGRGVFVAAGGCVLVGERGVLVGGTDVLVAVGGCGVFVAAGGCVLVGERGVLVAVGGKVLVSEGSMVLVLVKKRVAVKFDNGVSVFVRVWLGPIVRDGILVELRPGRPVAAAALVGFNPRLDCRVARASRGLTGVISVCEQNWPVNVQASARSSGESGWGGDGGLTADVPSGPPRSMLVL